MEKPTQEQTKQELAIGYAINSFFSNYSLLSDTSQQKLQEVYDDLDVRSALNTIVKEIQGRKANVKSKSNNEKLAADILSRHNKIDKNILIDNILKPKWFKYSITEILWGDNYTITGIKRQLNENFDLKLEDGKYVWYEVYSNLPVPWYKAIISVNDPDDNNPYGQTELLPLLKLFEIKQNILSAVNSIVKKYGGVITWFTYNAEGTTDAQLDEMIAGAEGIGDETVIPIPTRANGSQGYNKDFGFVPLSDLTTDVHMSLEAWIEKSITKYILGGTLTQDVGSSGSYAASQTHQEIRIDIINGYLSYTLQEMQKLIEIDSVIYGYNSDDIYWTLENAADETALVKLNQEKANVIQTVSVNYDIAPEYVSEVLGIPIEYITKKEIGFAPSFSKMKEFSKVGNKKRALDKKQIDNTYEQIENEKKKITIPLSETMIKEVSKLKSVNDVMNIDIILPDNFDEYLTIATLQGHYDILQQGKLSKKVVEFAEDKPLSLFGMPYDEAIKYIQDKEPALYDDLDEISKDSAKKYFWVKKSTSLELTKKVQNSLIKTLSNGKSFKEWKKDFETGLIDLGIQPTGSYTETVYRTNMQSGYAAGRYDRQAEQKNNFMYWEYVALNDSVTTDICSELDGKVYKADDPIWNSIYPPNHYNCRSSIIAYSQEDINEDDTIKPVSNGEEIKNTNAYKKFETTSFVGNPSTTVKKDMTSMIKDKEKSVKANQKELENLAGD